LNESTTPSRRHPATHRANVNRLPNSTRVKLLN
jgi:hypothetical protein